MSGIRMRQRRERFVVTFEPRLFHSEWSEDAAVTQSFVFDAGNALQDVTKDHVTRIGINMTRTNLTCGFTVRHGPFENVVRIAELAGIFAQLPAPFLAQRKVPQPCRVIQQMRQRDASRVRMYFADELRGKKIRKARIETEFAFFDELHQKRCREYLRHARN